MSQNTERTSDEGNESGTHQVDNEIITLNSIKPAPTQLSTDQRVPFEVWQQICSYLYPSQLSRMSTVSSTLHNVVGSLPFWSLLFHRIFGTTKTLYLLPLVPESKSYMLYMCASSSLICERCYTYFSCYPDVANAAALPLPVLVQSYSRLHEFTEEIGCPVDPNWTTQLCLVCRKTHYTKFKESVPYAAQKNFVLKDTISKKYRLHIDEYRSMEGSRFVEAMTREYPESKIITLARSKYGGDVGIGAMVAGSIDMRFERTDRRIKGYSHR